MKLKNFHRLAALWSGCRHDHCPWLPAAIPPRLPNLLRETAEFTETASSEAADAATDETLPQMPSTPTWQISPAFPMLSTRTAISRGVTATDYVTLPDDYADITINADLGQVSEEDIDNYITSNVLSKFSTTERVTDGRAAADGDTVNIDYVGRIDGVAFDGGDTKGNGADLTLGSGNLHRQL